MSITEIVQKYCADIIIRRWFATWVDTGGVFVVLGVIGLVLDAEPDWLLIGIMTTTLFVYHALPEAALGVTPGKWLAGVRVVDESGHPPGIAASTIRTLVRLIEVNPVLLGGIPAGLIAGNTRYRQRLGDLLARTFVVKVADLRAHFPETAGARLRGPESRILDKRLR